MKQTPTEKRFKKINQLRKRDKRFSLKSLIAAYRAQTDPEPQKE